MEFGYTSRGCPHFRKFRKMLLYSSLKISRNVNQNFSSNGKCPGFSSVRTSLIAQFRYIKIQPKTIDLSTRLVGITTEFVGFIPTSLVLRSIVLG